MPRETIVDLQHMQVCAGCKGGLCYHVCVFVQSACYGNVGWEDMWGHQIPSFQPTFHGLVLQ